MKKNPKNYTIRKRKDCDRWELIIRAGDWGKFYGGLYKTEKEALIVFQEKWLGVKRNKINKL